MAEIRDGYIKVTTYAYDLNNRLLYSENDTELCRYEYDAQGNQNRRIIQNTAYGSVAETEFIWNGDNMLAYSIDPSGQRSSYGYGPDGLRVRKTVGDATTRFFYEGGNILIELDGRHRITTKTTRGIRLISRETLTTEYGYLLDGHGDVAALVSPAGELVLDYAYDPFGRETGFQPDNADTWDNPFRYCGEYWDAETQTYYLRARQYDPTTGRFLSEDTHWNPRNMLYGDDPIQLLQNIYAPNILAIMQGSNLHVYCISNPLKYADTNGDAITLIGVSIVLAQIGTAIIIPATYVGIATGATDAYNGETFEAGFINGFVSSAVGSSIASVGKTIAIRWGPKIFEYAGIALEPPGGAAVGSWVEDWIFNKDKSWEERLESSIEAAKKEIMSGIGALYFKLGVDSMNRIFKDHFPPAVAFGESIEHLVNGLMTVVSTSEVNKE